MLVEEGTMVWWEGEARADPWETRLNGSEPGTQRPPRSIGRLVADRLASRSVILSAAAKFRPSLARYGACEPGSQGQG